MPHVGVAVLDPLAGAWFDEAMADPVALTQDSSLARRLWAWADERFPVVNCVLFAVLYTAALLWGRFLVLPGGVDLPLMARDLAGLLASIAFFLMLRVFDEHKDFELDSRNHPQRVLQRGLISLSHLKVAGAIAIVVQLAVSLWQDHAAGRTFGYATQIWLIVMVWSALMAKEFFIGEWLSKRLFLYALSHMVVMPMALVWMAQLGMPVVRLPGSVLYLALLSFLSGFAFEITRKTKAPEDERDTVDSYTRVFGTRGAPVVIALLCVAQAVVMVLMLRKIFPGGVHVAWYAGPLVIAALPALTLSTFARTPTPKAAKKNEGAVSLAMLAGYAVLIAALISARGLAWL